MFTVKTGLQRTEVDGVYGGYFAAQRLHDEGCHCVSNMAREDVSCFTPRMSSRYNDLRYRTRNLPINYLIECQFYHPRDWAVSLTWLATARTLVSGTNESMISLRSSS